MTEEEMLQDFRRRYEHTYILVREPQAKEQHLQYVEAVEPHSDKIGVIKLYSTKFGRSTLNFGSQHTFVFPPAPVGVFQYQADSMLCRRHPAKQYRRGLCADNTTIVPVTQHINDYAVINSPKFQSSLIEAAFEARKYTLKEALAMLGAEKYRSVALDANYSLVQSYTNNADYLLYLWDSPIARINSKGEVSHIYEKVHETNIKQFIVGNAQ